jgi:hypothetical protein
MIKGFERAAKKVEALATSIHPEDQRLARILRELLRNKQEVIDDAPRKIEIPDWIALVHGIREPGSDRPMNRPRGITNNTTARIAEWLKALETELGRVPTEDEVIAHENTAPVNLARKRRRLLQVWESLWPHGANSDD